MQKSLSFHRSDSDPQLSWWGLPLSLRQFCRCFASALRDTHALVEPTSAVDAVDAALLRAGETQRDIATAVHRVGDRAGCDPEAEIGTVLVRRAPAIARRTRPGTLPGVQRFSDPIALLELADERRVGPCRITIQRTDAVPLFHIEIPQQADSRLRFCFLRRGDAVRALESLALERRFAADPVVFDRLLHEHEDFRRVGEHPLRLVLEKCGARLESVSADGCRRTIYAQSGSGWMGTCETTGRWQVRRARWAEWRRRFPVNFVLFAGLPLFIGFLRLNGALLRRLRS